MTEAWRRVPGFDRHEASDLGRLRSFTRWPEGRILQPSVRTLPNGTQRRVATLMYQGRTLGPTTMARIVLLAFIGPCPDGMEACHGERGSLCDELSNLRWDTHLSNMHDRYRDDGYKTPKGESHPHTPLTADDVRCIRAEPRFLGVNTMLANAFGVTESSIRAIRSGKTWASEPQHL